MLLLLLLLLLLLPYYHNTVVGRCHRRQLLHSRSEHAIR